MQETRRSETRASAGAKLRSSLGGRPGEVVAHTLRIVIRAIDGSPRLLAPRFVQRSRIHAIESELIEEANHDRLRFRIVASHRKRDSPGCPGRLAAIEQMLGVDVVEHLDRRAPELIRHPPALRGAALDLLDAAV